MARQITMAVLLIFSMIMIVNTYIVWHNAQTAMQTQVQEQVSQMNRMYFDSLNTLMLTGNMDQREALREKLLNIPNVVNARVIRSDAVVHQFGQGFASEHVVDDIDKLALQGQDVVRINDVNEARILTVALPYRATSSSYRGNCLKCHDVAENTINGVVRIDYSLQHADQMITNTLWETLMVNSIVLIMGIVLLAFYMNQNLTHGIREADIVAEAIAQQNFDIEMPAVRKDNLGRLMFSLIKMRDALIQQFELIKLKAEDERQVMSAQLKQQEKESNLVVAFESGIVNIVKNLKHTSQEVSGSASLLSDISSELNQNTIKASAGTTDVLEQVADTSHATHKINESFKDVSKVSQEAIHISQQAMDDAGATSKRMKTLQVASDNIGSVIATITEIAEKTNLLALNASIEAARAGDVGRGFAVVASEVKSLANQTSNATKVIAQQIAEVQAECKGAIDSIAEISQVIQQMNTHTLHIADAMLQYTTTLEELDENTAAASQGMQSVGHAVSGVHQAAERSDDISTEVAQYCEQLQNIAMEQEQLVVQFLAMLQGIRNDDMMNPKNDEDELF